MLNNLALALNNNKKEDAHWSECGDDLQNKIKCSPSKNTLAFFVCDCHDLQQTSHR